MCQKKEVLGFSIFLWLICFILMLNCYINKLVTKSTKKLLSQLLDRLVTGFFVLSAFLAGFTIFLERSSLAGGFRLSGVFVYFFEGSFF